MTEPSEETTPAKEYYAERRRERAMLRGDDRKRRRGLSVFAAVLAALLLTLGAEVALSYGHIHRGVSVAGVNVGGMIPERADAVLSSALASRAAEPVTVTHDDRKWVIVAEQIGLGFDESAQIKAAMSVGRDEDFFKAVSERVRCWTKGVDVGAFAVAQGPLLDATLAKVAKDVDVAPIDASVKIEGVEPRVVDGKDGRALDRQSLSKTLVKVFTQAGSETVDAPIVVDPMKVTAREAAQAVEVASTMLSGPVRVTYEKEQWDFPAKAVAAWMDFRTVESSSTSAAVLEPFISAKKASTPIAKALGTNVGRPAKDARFKAEEGRVTIIPSQDGIGPDVEDLSLVLTEELKDSSADRSVELRTSRTEPEITTEKARAMGIKERISSYTTTYDSGNRPRVNNIHLLGDALNGTLVAPGGTFSFNGTAGERTAAKGYQEAGAIVNGRLVPQLGGGVCQVGTTIFNTIFESGLPVIERRNHSFYISHYPTGRDATVSWGGPDFKFKNDTPNWVLVAVSYTNSSITIALYGTDPGYEVTAETSAWRNIRPFPIEKIDDPQLSVGMMRVEDGGVQGRSITVRRIVSKGGKVLRTDTFVSNYKPKTEVVRVGTKPKPSGTVVPAP